MVAFFVSGIKIFFYTHLDFTLQLRSNHSQRETAITNFIYISPRVLPRR